MSEFVITYIEILKKEIEDKKMVIRTMQDYEKRLEEDRIRMDKVLHMLYMAGDAMAITCKSEKHVQAWWDAKSRS